MAKEIYYSMDRTKFIVEKIIDWWTETTYIWEALYQKDKLQPEMWYIWPDDTAKEIRRIKKIIEDSQWNMEVFYPEGDDSKRFVRDDRYSLNYV